MTEETPYPTESTESKYEWINVSVKWKSLDETWIGAEVRRQVPKGYTLTELEKLERDLNTFQAITDGKRQPLQSH